MLHVSKGLDNDFGLELWTMACALMCASRAGQTTSSREESKGKGDDLGNGWTPNWNNVARHLVQVPANELQWLGAHDAVDQVNAVKQGWHCRSKGAKIVCQSLHKTPDV